MSTRIPRLRLQIATSDHERPADTRVLCRQQMGWVILLGAFLALLCIPPFRIALLTQTRAAWTYRSPAWATTDESHRRRMAGVLENTRNQPLLQLGAVTAGAINTEAQPNHHEANPPTFADTRSDPRLTYYEGVAERFPDDPAVIAGCLRIYTQRAVLVRRPELDPYSDRKITTQLLDPATLARVERYVEQGQKADPNNGFFQTMLAVAQVAAGQDQAALASLASASRCQFWYDYAHQEGYGARNLLIQAYGDHGLTMHVAPLFSILLPHFVGIRHTARVARGIADREARVGNLTAEHSIRTDLIRLGALMRVSADTLIGRLVGNAIREIGFQPWGKEKHPPGQSNRREALLDQFTAYAREVNQEAPDLSAEVEASLVAYRDHPVSDESSYFTDPSTRVLAAAQLREVISLTLLQQAGVALLLWAAAAVLAALAGWGSRRLPGRPGGRRWSDVPVLHRGLHLGVGLLPFLFAMLTGALDAVGSILFGAFALLLVHRTARGETLRWPVGQVTALTLGGLALATIGLLSVGQAINESWYQVSLLSSFLTMEGMRQVKDTWSTAFIPLPLALGLLVLITGFVRGGSTPSLLDGLRLSARAVSALLVTAYLGALLWTVPADRAATVAFDDLIAREIRGLTARR